MARRKTIGENPLDSVIPGSSTATSAATVEAEPEAPARPAGRSHSRAKQRLTVHLPLDLIDRVKNAVYWTPGLTLARLAEEALAEAVDLLEEERGEPFPPREDELRGGRPLK